MSIVITGSPEPEVAAAIVACVAAVLAQDTPPPPQVSAWRRAAIRDNLRNASIPSPGVAWRAPGSVT